MRRISCELHGADDVDYQRDIFGDPTVLGDPKAKDNLVHLVTSIIDLQSKSDFELDLDFPELMGGGRHMSTAEARALHRRWADQAALVLHSHTVSGAMLSGSLS